MLTQTGRAVHADWSLGGLGKGHGGAASGSAGKQILCPQMQTASRRQASPRRFRSSASAPRPAASRPSRSFSSTFPPTAAWRSCVVQHLAPAHEQHPGGAPGPQVAAAGQRGHGRRWLVEADHAYVIPPGFDLRLEGGRLRLTPRDQAQRPPMPIDGFFRSLAGTLGRRAIGVVLSGAASDGTLGLSAIKSRGRHHLRPGPDGRSLRRHAARGDRRQRGRLRPHTARDRRRAHAHRPPPLRGLLRELEHGAARRSSATAKDLYAQVFTALQPGVRRRLHLLQVQHHRPPHRPAHGAAPRRPSLRSTSRCCARTPPSSRRSSRTSSSW